ncbi:MAG: hypothetical protein WC370_06105 [Dehalococcoidales bacterium]|jgi:hypothetical protein
MKALRITAFTLVILIAAAGAALIIFNILDFSIESTRMHPPATLVYALPIAAAALAAAFAAAIAFAATGSQQVLWLGCGALALGLGYLIGGWSADNVNTGIAIRDSTGFITALLFLVGASLSLNQRQAVAPNRPARLSTALWCYLGVAACLAVIAVLVLKEVLPPFHIIEQGATALKNNIQMLSVVFAAAAAIFSLRIYWISRQGFAYWHFLGLGLFLLALFYGSQSTVDSVLSWLGRITMFLSGLYFFVAAIVLRRESLKSSE